MAEWGRTTLELIVEELQQPVRLDESFERRVMVRVRRLYAQHRRGMRGWLGVASQVTHHPGWAAALAAGVVAVVTLGVMRTRPPAPSPLVATNHQGVWSVTAPVPAGVHRYAFVVNGKEWVADPSAPRSASDDFGLPSSALVVEDSTR